MQSVGWESLKARAVSWLRPEPTSGGLASRANASELVWRAATWLVLAYAAIEAARAYGAGFDTPILDRHAFRQTQTALSTYWIVHGGPWLAYETPVFGAPYSAPFEFPLYQWIVALVHLTTRAPLDQAGRAISIAFFVATTIPFFRLLARSGVSPACARLGVALFLVAPEYLYWSRTFLIESTALFFAVATLALGLDVLEKPSIDRRLGWLFGASALALLVKVTTAFGYELALGVIALCRIVRDRDRRSHVRPYGAFFAAAFVLPAVPFLAWTRFADAMKSRNPLSVFITSGALHDWNYGTLAQKTAPGTWQTFWDRTMGETFGTSIGFVACGAVALLLARRLDVLVAVVLGALGIYAVFTNLQLVHDYYQYSTAALAVAVVGLGFGAAELANVRSRLLILLASGLMIACSTATYEHDYLPGQKTVDTGPVHVGDFIKGHTDPSALIAIYGDDWSSVIPYYSERRAIMDRDNHDPNDAVVRDALARSAAKGNPLGAVVSCYGQRSRSRDRATKLLARTPACTAVAACEICL